MFNSSWNWQSKSLGTKGSKPIKYISGTKIKVNIGGFYTEDNKFFHYDLGEKQNTISFVESLKKIKKWYWM